MLIGYQRSLQQTEQLLDADMQEKSKIISDLFVHSDRPIFPGDGISILDVPGDSAFTIFQMVDKVGGVVYQSGDFGKTPLTVLSPNTHFFNYKGYRWRTFIHEDSRLDLWIIVAERDDLRFRVADTMVVAILKPILMGLFCIVFLVWLVVYLGFKPIQYLTTSIRERSASDLSEISMDNVPEELRAISESVNELFKRLAASFERERRFTSNAAHEMRNPITAAIIQVDNLMDEHPEMRDTLLKIKQPIDRLWGLVEQMLILHRMSPDQYQANFCDINLQAVTQDIIAELYPDIEKKSHIIELDGPECHINADLFGIELLIRNLITNAIKYTPDHGHIRVRLLDRTVTHPGVSILVDDSGVGIPDFEKHRVFDRFYRIGGDRHGSKTVGSGLGLSIVNDIVELHHALLRLNNSELGGLSVEVFFPDRFNGK
jgi:two-component system sensor histidine kinase QseC